MNNTLVLKTILSIIEDKRLNDGFEKLDREYLNIPIQELIKKSDINIIKYCVFRGFKEFNQGFYWSVYYKKEDLIKYFLYEFDPDIKYGAFACMRINDIDNATKYFNWMGQSPLYDYDTFEYNFEVESEICKSGDIERFDKYIDFAIQINNKPKTSYLQRYLTSSVESLKLDMVKYIVENSFLQNTHPKSILFLGRYYNLLNKIKDMLDYPSSELINIVKYLYECDFFEDKVRTVFIMLLMKVEEWDYITNIHLNLDDYSNYFIFNRVVWFTRNEDYYNKFKHYNNMLRNNDLINYIDILDDDAEINSFDKDFKRLLSITAIASIPAESY